MVEFIINGSDRKYQLWERNALSISLRNQFVFKQKLDYIHTDPVVAGLRRYQEDYRYSSAAFYEKRKGEWDFLTHYMYWAGLLVKNTNKPAETKTGANTIDLQMISF